MQEAIQKYSLSDKQRKALELLEESPILFYGGARGGGKSFLVRVWQIDRRLSFAGTHGLIIRKTYPELYENHVLKFFEEYPFLVNYYNKGEKIFYFPNGSTLTMSYLQYATDVYTYFGREYEDIAIDEAQDHQELVFKILRASNRTINPNISPRMLLTGTPGGIGHGWLKRIFIDRQFKEEENPNDFVFLKARVWDNKVLLKADPSYIKRLGSLPTEQRKAYLEGSWDFFAGQCFSEFNRERHVIESFDYPLSSCRRIIGFDWGYNAPGCAIWLAYTPDGRAYAHREIYQNQKTPEQWAKDIKVFTDIEPVEYIVLPHDCFSVIQGRESIADTFRRELGVPIRVGRTLQKDARKNRLAITHQYLSNAPDGQPYLQIHVNCQNLIRTLPELIYDQHNPEDIDSAGEDHAYDSLSVGLMERIYQTIEAGAVKFEGGKKTIEQWTVSPAGEIKGVDFAKQFAEQAKRKPSTTGIEFRQK